MLIGLAVGLLNVVALDPLREAAHEHHRAAQKTRGDVDEIERIRVSPRLMTHSKVVRWFQVRDAR